MSGIGISEFQTKIINLITKYIRNNGTYWEFIAEMIHLWPEFAELLNNWRKDTWLIDR